MNSETVTIKRIGPTSAMKAGAAMGLVSGYVYFPLIRQQIDGISDWILILLVVVSLGPLGLFPSLRNKIVAVLAFYVINSVLLGVTFANQSGKPFGQVFPEVVGLIVWDLVGIFVFSFAGVGLALTLVWVVNSALVSAGGLQILTSKIGGENTEIDKYSGM